jgi:hypothetical protein
MQIFWQISVGGTKTYQTKHRKFGSGECVREGKECENLRIHRGKWLKKCIIMFSYGTSECIQLVRMWCRFPWLGNIFLLVSNHLSSLRNSRIKRSFKLLHTAYCTSVTIVAYQLLPRFAKDRNQTKQ